MAKKLTAETVERKDFDNAIKTINCYYRKITGREECLAFYVDKVQPIVIIIEDIEKSKNEKV
jgi:hypothetical protein